MRGVIKHATFKLRSCYSIAGSAAEAAVNMQAAPRFCSCIGYGAQHASHSAGLLGGLSCPWRIAGPGSSSIALQPPKMTPNAVVAKISCRSIF